MKKAICFIIFAVFLTFPVESFGQGSSEEARGAADTIFAKRSAFPFKKRLTGKQKSRLQPAAEDSARFASFLKQPRTGLTKIFPDIGCEENANVIRADADCLSSIPNSAFYSFREKEHTTEYLADLRLADGFFVSDGILSQGILVSLGDVSLENLSLAAEGLKFLREFAPETNSKDALRQTIELAKGVRQNKFEYKKSLPVAENTTYALRVVAYRGSFRRVFRGVEYDVLARDARADLILAFRVVRKSKDGSLTLLWKELERKDSPKIIFPKKKKSKK